MKLRIAFACLLLASHALLGGGVWHSALAAQGPGSDGGGSGSGSGGGGDDGDDSGDPATNDDPDDPDSIDGSDADSPDDGGDGDVADDDNSGSGSDDGGSDSGSDDGSDNSGHGGADDGSDNSGSGSDDSNSDNSGSGKSSDDSDDDDSADDDADKEDNSGKGNSKDDGQWDTGSGESDAERAQLDKRDRIETDDEGFRYRRGEFVALDLGADELAQLKADGFEVVESTQLDTVTGTLLLLRAPASLTDEAALDTLDGLADPDSVGFNHLFDGAAVKTTRRRDATVPQRMACGCEVGLIDTGVASSLDKLSHVTITQRAFNAKDTEARMHGTAVASIMSGTTRNPARATKIVVADIFSGPRDTSGSSFALIKAIDWLAGQGVPVINISLSGPRNPAVAKAVARITARGHLVVAAAGNDGPAAPPVFPGAYEGVVGVTAVDAQDRVYRYANRGDYVDFAARGVAVTTLDQNGAVRDATGTSFAAPVIAARLAAKLRKPGVEASRKAVRELEAEARDLGAKGRDPVYGAGLIGDSP